MEEKAEFRGDRQPDIDPTGFFLVRPPITMPLKIKGTAGPQRGRVTSAQQSGAPSPCRNLPFPPPHQIKELWDLGVEGIRDFLSSLFDAEEPRTSGLLIRLISYGGLRFRLEPGVLTPPARLLPASKRATLSNSFLARMTNDKRIKKTECDGLDVCVCPQNTSGVLEFGGGPLGGDGR